MRIAICDDEERCRVQVLEFLREYSRSHTEHHPDISVFSAGEDLLEAAGKLGGFDIYILDIVMPHMDGIRLGTELRSRGYDGKIIYLTSSKEYAIDSFRVKPFHYILKPFDRADFRAVLDEAVDAMAEQKQKSIIVKTQDSRIKIHLHRILYAELSRRTVQYHMTDGRTVESIHIRSSFTEAVQELLQDNRFCLCGAEMLVNLQHLIEVENECLVFKNSCRLNAGKKACRDVRSAWYDYNFDGEGSK